MEYISLFDDEASEQARKKAQTTYLRYLLALFLKLLWTSLTLSALVGLLIPLTNFLGGLKVVLPCLLGLLTGISLTAGVLTSLQNRTLITLFLGLLILPGLAIYLSFMAGSNPQAFDASSSVLLPFLVYALASLIGGIIIVKIWRNISIMERNKDAGKEPVQVLTSPKKGDASHEGSREGPLKGSDFNKAA